MEREPASGHDSQLHGPTAELGRSLSVGQAFSLPQRFSAVRYGLSEIGPEDPGLADVWQPHPPSEGDDTRSRLLKAAAEVFAERGYENATIRQICHRAAANVALVNYYFGDKLELYTEVLRFSMHAGARQPGLQPAPQTDDPEDALRQMIRVMVERALEMRGRAGLRFRLMMHECAQPTGATARVVDEVLKPVYDRLRQIVSAILALPPDHDTTRLAVHSILGQVMHYAHSIPVLTRLWPGMKMTPEQRQMVVNHITDFTLAYLRATRCSRARPANRKQSLCKGKLSSSRDPRRESAR